MYEQEILNELRQLSRNFERLFSQGHAVDPVSEAVQTRELEFRQYKRDLKNAPDNATRRKIERAWNDKRKKEMKAKRSEGPPMLTDKDIERIADAVFRRIRDYETQQQDARDVSVLSDEDFDKWCKGEL